MKLEVGDLVKLKDHKVWYRNALGKIVRRPRKGDEGVIDWIAHRGEDTLLEIRVEGKDKTYLVTPEDLEYKVYNRVDMLDPDCEQALAEMRGEE